MVVDILRAQPGESLTTVLYTPATSAQVTQWGALRLLELFKHLYTLTNSP